MGLRTATRFWALGLSTIFAVFASSCGKKDDNQRRELLPPRETLQPPAQHYFLADPTCLEAAPTQPTPIESGKVFRVTPDFTLTDASEDHPIAGLNIRSEASLVSPSVSTTTYGGVYERICPASLASGQCLPNGRHRDWAKKVAPKPLRLCSAASDYDRESFEGIALTNIVYLERVTSRFREQGIKVPPIALEILPKHVSVHTNERNPKTGERVAMETFITHNLGYFRDEQKIAVWPEPAKYDQLFKDKGHLWESPFGIGHEAGHHLEQLVPGGASLSALGAVWDGYSHSYRHAPRKVDGAEEATTPMRVVSSLSEGFADLAAFYALDEDESAVTSMYCIGRNRNPRDSQFVFLDLSNGQVFDRQPKRLDRQVIATLFGPSLPSNCDTPNFSDIHTIGAIIAYAHDALFQTALDVSPRSISEHDRSRAKLTMTIDWFNVTSEALRASGPTPSMLKSFQPLTPGIEAAVGRFFDRESLDDAARAAARARICEKAKETLPALDPLPFASACKD